MPPNEFWMKLLDPATMVAFGALVATLITAWANSRKIDKNTAITVETKQTTEQQAKKVESAVKGAEQAATEAADAAAKKVAMATGVTAEKVAAKAAETALHAKDSLDQAKKKMDEILVAFNGRYSQKMEIVREEGRKAGLLEAAHIGELVQANIARIEHLEKGHDDLRRGQDEIINRIDEAMNAILAKIKPC
jgi:type VI protein secretion system component VasK